ncbi:hypothetical protein JCGZ_25665 [Jatropha curcas]|uniref:Uncharacterized protein n=1 Tax=Jatropha curcas TaxID=180498 RepID=A0A067JXU9_JATCU|nr:hypothetical protein JCGZ_25665 [Jatropha curcas]
MKSLVAIISILFAISLFSSSLTTARELTQTAADVNALGDGTIGQIDGTIGQIDKPQPKKGYPYKPYPKKGYPYKPYPKKGYPYKPYPRKKKPPPKKKKPPT